MKLHNLENLSFFLFLLVSLVSCIPFWARNVWMNAKGQKKSKRFFQADVSSKKRTNEFYFTTYETSGRLVFVHFWMKLMTPKRHFEIIWPLENREYLSLLCLGEVKNWRNHNFLMKFPDLYLPYLNLFFKSLNLQYVMTYCFTA